MAIPGPTYSGFRNNHLRQRLEIYNRGNLVAFVDADGRASWNDSSYNLLVADADPTATADATAEIQSYLDAAVPSPATNHTLNQRAAVIVPDGDFLVDGTLVARPGTALIGLNQQGSRIVMGWRDSLEKFKTYNDSLTTDTNNFQFRNLTVRPDYTQTAPAEDATVFRIRGSVEPSWQNVRIIQHLGAVAGGDLETLTAFSLEKCVDINMLNVSVDGGAYGIRGHNPSTGSNGSRFGRFTHIFLYNQIEYGIDLADTSESNSFDAVRITQPSARGTARTGMRIGTGCFNNQVTNLRSGGAEQLKALVVAGNGNVISGAHLRASGTGGVALTVTGDANVVSGYNAIGETTHKTNTGTGNVFLGHENSVAVFSGTA